MADHPTFALGIENGSSIAWSAPERFQQELANISRAARQHLYLVLLGPKLIATGFTVSPSTRKYRLDVSYATLKGPKTLTIKVPPGAFPKDTLSFDEDTQVLTLVPVAGGQARKVTVAEVVRATIEAGQETESWVEKIVNQFFTFEVAYIGQSYGTNGSSGAIDRLVNGHSTVDKILSDTLSYSHNREVAFITLDQQLTTMDAHLSTGQDPKERQAIFWGISQAWGAGPITDLVVDAAEASLITAFKPEWNMVLKDFTKKDAPSMLKALRDFHVTHLRIRIDLTQSYAKVIGPVRGVASARHSWAFNLDTGAIELPGNAPIQWTITDY